MKFTVAAALLAAPAAAFTPVAGRTQMKMGMEKQIASAALAGAMMFGAGSSAFAASIGEGENVFNANCAACHAGGQNVIQNEKTLQQDALKQYLDGGMKESSVVYQVTNGSKSPRNL
mmetsp:Transcript_32007/g.101864  ORF Transcript_32007/g.101864 Transcript_32007/m.101864 type:complete len:117 (-) Transcript_32007:1004-1354(-)